MILLLELWKMALLFDKAEIELWSWSNWDPFFIWTFQGQIDLLWNPICSSCLSCRVWKRSPRRRKQHWTSLGCNQRVRRIDSGPSATGSLPKGGHQAQSSCEDAGAETPQNPKDTIPKDGLKIKTDPSPTPVILCQQSDTRTLFWKVRLPK